MQPLISSSGDWPRVARNSFDDPSEFFYDLRRRDGQGDFTKVRHRIRRVSAKLDKPPGSSFTGTGSHPVLTHHHQRDIHTTSSSHRRACHTSKVSDPSDRARHLARGDPMRRKPWEHERYLGDRESCLSLLQNFTEQCIFGLVLSLF